LRKFELDEKMAIIDQYLIIGKKVKASHTRY